MRITFQGADYTYRILTRSIDQFSRLIRIELDGTEYELVPGASGDWHAADATIMDRHDLLRAIARNVALRYRL